MVAAAEGRALRLLIAGATGAIGRPLVPALLEAGHEVWGLSRDEQRARALDATGARGVVGDALDADSVKRAADQAQPDLVMQQLTALPERITKRSMAEGYAQTDRLRTHGTRNLMEAAPRARVIAQSIAFVFAPEGGWVKDEDAPLHTEMETVARLQEMERAVVARDGTVLRYGYFYGPGTWYAREGEYGRMARKRMLAIWGSGEATASFLHVDDAVAATVRAVEAHHPGVFHVADDDPAPQREWIPAFCRAVGAKPPRKLPTALVRPLAGRMGRFFLTQTRGADNARFKSATGWAPRHASWREGFATL